MWKIILVDEANSVNNKNKRGINKISSRVLWARPFHKENWWPLLLFLTITSLIDNRSESDGNCFLDSSLEIATWLIFKDKKSEKKVWMKKKMSILKNREVGQSIGKKCVWTWQLKSCVCEKLITSLDLITTPDCARFWIAYASQRAILLKRKIYTEEK